MEDIIIQILLDITHVTLVTTGFMVAFASLYDTYKNWDIT
mgnify:FL=1